MPRDGSDMPRPERPEPRQVTPDQIRLAQAREQIAVVHDREREMAVEVFARDAALADLRKKNAELEAQLSAMCADLEAKDARIAELEAAAILFEPAVTGVSSGE